ncbi:uncharacterized protein LOC114180695 [Vigna unguiculata]|uniref:uncharacterized protein LOC114180695 n=1 Tax=Vigna unguiculata TaxID=3917 RepID=UPI001016AE97|nr:uncharacterized protein LOC114180695 [Vigna unguiculata]
MLQMEESDQICEYFTKILTITNQMKSCGETITELMIVEKIMRSLPRKFDYIAVAIEESHDLAAMKVEELQSSLEAHEMRLVNRSPIKNSEQALKAHHLKYDERKKQGRWKGKRTQNTWKNRRYEHDSDQPDASEKKGGSWKCHKKKGYDKRNIECFNCHKKGHYANECYADRGKQKKHQDKEVHVVQEESDSDPLTLMVTNFAEETHTKSWFLDSGCSNHMIGHKEWLVNFDSSKKSKVKFADDSTLRVEGVGDVVIVR